MSELCRYLDVMYAPSLGHALTLRQSRCSMTSLLTSQVSTLPCMIPVASSLPYLKRTHHSLQNSTLKLTTCMGITLRRLMPPKCEQLPEVTVNMITPLPDRTLLERVGLGNQMLMVRLRLPFKTLPNLTQVMSSPSNLGTSSRADSLNVPVMMRGMTKVTMPGIGTNLAVVHHGKTSMREPSPLQGKPTFSRTPISPTLSDHSRALNPNKVDPTSPQSSGEMSLQTDKSTLEHWLKTNMQGSPPMMQSSTLPIISRSQQKGQARPKPRLLMTPSGTLHGQNIQWQFCGPTHTGRKNSAPMASTSLGNSLQVSTSVSTSNLTKLHASSSMGTNSCALPTSANLASSLTRSSCHANSEGAAVLMLLPQAPPKVLDVVDGKM